MALSPHNEDPLVGGNVVLVSVGAGDELRPVYTHRGEDWKS
jgi:hypothetical protein